MGSNPYRGKTALISGAGSGIGYELAVQFADHGANIIVTDIRKERIDKAVEIISKKGVKVQGYVVDHSDFTQVEDFCRQVLADIGQVDILCCNAGIGHSGSIGNVPIKDWEWVVGINYWGQIYLINQFVPPMMERNCGWVLITASAAGLFPLAGMSAYCCTKSALVFLANIMQMELRKHNINVSALCPGIINTNIIRDGKLQGEVNQAFATKMYEKIGTHPSKVARTGIRGLRRNKAIIPAPFYHVFVNHFLYRLWPPLLLRWGAFLYERGWNFLGPLLK
jgi:short-subunit dehydrogenase